MNYSQNYFQYAEYVKSLVTKTVRPATKKEWNKLQAKGDTRYFEFHHILPKCMGGDESLENYIPLTAREHFLAHYLLWKIHQTCETGAAFWRMCYSNKKKYFNSRLYEVGRLAAAAANKSENKRKKISKALTGKKRGPRSEETKQKISKSTKGKTMKERINDPERYDKFILKMKDRHGDKNPAARFKYKVDSTFAHSFSKQVVCLDTKEVFPSVLHAQLKYRVFNVSRCCSHERRKAAGLHFEYYENQSHEWMDQRILEIKQEEAAIRKSAQKKAAIKGWKTRRLI